MSDKSYDVAILGGGIVGTAIAWQLLEADPQLKVILIEKKDIGSGSTSRSAAAFRHQFSSKGNILLSKESYKVYQNFNERFGLDKSVEVFREYGYLLLYTQKDLLEKAQSRAKIQQSQGVPVEILSPAEIEAHPRLKGFFNQEEILGATWCERDGFLDPLLVAQTFYAAAKAKGLTLHKAEATGFIKSDNLITGIETSNGAISAKKTVNACGWLSNKLLGPLGLAVPQIPVKRYLYITTPVRGTDVSKLPMVVCDLEPYMRPEAGNALLMGWDALPRTPSVESLEEEFDYEALEALQDIVDPEFTNDEYGLEVRARMADVVPLLESDQLRLFQEACGYYQITADEKPILSTDPRVDGLIHACGFSGHGVMHAPAAAQIITGMILGHEGIPGIEEGSFDLGPLLENKDRPDPEHMSI
ncbi:MAG: FAD-binding oxidoreductase [Planctomycetota bacterium]|nr:FAD-binding oxidoreductase [Planctomycetota bacterium]